jgi:hypothetical protein
MVSTKSQARANRPGFSPTNHITAIFDSSERLPTVLDAIRNLGWSNGEIHVFAGLDAAESLDLAGHHLGSIRRVLRGFEMFLSDETRLREEMDEALSQGSFLVAIRAPSDERKKERAVQILRANDARAICAWGHWAIERH